ncbi:MAG: bifunctional adenosylcobinamide kinase/adenosylcobinamide-phosphate guanylyltransferase [Nitrospiraceae bacterium]|nr:bifunctional adenosylcobinamide kinase/adenosylcobinamide-phosphate guanylyltransferase [Nitrospiraceae bacterium]
MGELIFVLGGARSGKSGFALKECDRLKGRKAFIATADVKTLDEEMKARVEAHKRERGAEWESFEEPVNLPGLIERIGAQYDAVLIDCLTLWLSNLFLKKADVPGDSARLLRAIKGAKGTVFAVSNEVGMGIVPDSPLGRAFRDGAGRLNQLMAGGADRVYLVTAGIPGRIK